MEKEKREGFFRRHLNIWQAANRQADEQAKRRHLEQRMSMPEWHAAYMTLSVNGSFMSLSDIIQSSSDTHNTQYNPVRWSQVIDSMYSFGVIVKRFSWQDAIDGEERSVIVGADEISCPEVGYSSRLNDLMVQQGFSFDEKYSISDVNLEYGLRQRFDEQLTDPLHSPVNNGPDSGH